MKSMMVRYAMYNLWANKRIAALMLTLNTEDLHRDLGGSFHTVVNTVYHIWNAESIWWQRLMMYEHIILPAEQHKGDFVSAIEEWHSVSTAFIEFCKKQLDDKAFEHQVFYLNLQQIPMKNEVWECIQHAVNHSSFHRGQLVNYLRMLGKTKIPSTDFIAYCREQR